MDQERMGDEEDISESGPDVVPEQPSVKPYSNAKAQAEKYCRKSEKHPECHLKDFSMGTVLICYRYCFLVKGGSGCSHDVDATVDRESRTSNATSGILFAVTGLSAAAMMTVVRRL